MARHPEMVRLDLHVHTGRYSQCAEFLNPFRVGEFALRAGLAGVVITEHDMFWQDEEIELLREVASPARIYRGLEVSASGCHVLVIGIDDDAGFERRMRAEDVVRAAHAAGAVAVLAHPYRDSVPEELPLESFDAIEVGSSSFDKLESARSIRLARRYHKPMIASSDAHALSRIGWGWTEFPSLPANERELAEAIRGGFGRAVLPRTLKVRAMSG
jgi:predicted metal-dependent phosphoesterase TrpH